MLTAIGVACAPIPQEFDGTRFSGERYVGLGTLLCGLFDKVEAICAGLNPSPADHAALAKVWGTIAEPFLFKLLSLVETDALSAKVRQSQGGVGLTLHPLAEWMSGKLNRSPVKPTSNERTSLGCCLRDVLTDRNLDAHAAPEPDLPYVVRFGHSVAVLIYAIVEHNLKDLEKYRTQAQLALIAQPDRLPEHKKVPPEQIALATTRAADSVRWAEDLATARRTGNGAAFVVSGPVGWGKTQFIFTGVQRAQVPVVLVDLQDAIQGKHIAEAFIGNLGTEPSDERRLDRDPAFAARFLASRIPGTVVVVENSQACEEQVHELVGRCVDELVKYGIVVVVEAWSRIGAPNRRTITTLPPLDGNEIRAWYREVLGREPGVDGDLLENLLGGHPTLVRAGLDLFQARFPSTTPEENVALDAIFSISSTVDDRWIRAINRETHIPPDLAVPVPPRILTCMALLPWCDIPTNCLQQEERLALPPLAPLHLVQYDPVSDVWRGLPAIRFLANRALKPAVDTGGLDLALHIGGRLQADLVQKTRRHLTGLALRKLLRAEDAASLMATFPDVPPDASTGDEYEAAPPVLDADIQTLPIDAQLWAVEGRLRADDQEGALAGVHEVIERFMGSPELAGDWWIMKGMLRVLLRIQSSERRLEWFERVAPTFIRAAKSRHEAASRWAARFLAFAAERAKTLFLKLLPSMERTSMTDAARWRLATIATVVGDRARKAFWADLADHYERRMGRPHEFWQRVLENTEAIAVPELETNSDQSIVAIANDLTDSNNLKMVSTITRYGAGLDDLDLPLRKRLADISVSAAFGAEQWNRSWRDEDQILDRWRVGVSVLMALHVSGNQTVFGLQHAPFSKHRGGAKSWVGFMKDQLSVHGFGRFGAHADAIRAKAKVLGLTREPPPAQS